MDDVQVDFSHAQVVVRDGLIQQLPPGKTVEERVYRCFSKNEECSYEHKPVLRSSGWGLFMSQS